MPSVCQARSGSPFFGSSILITSAPKSASWRLTMLPETRRDMSTTRTPSSGHAAPGSKNFSAMLIDTDPASAQMHSDDSMPLSPRHPGAGRDPCPKWAPAFAGVTEFFAGFFAGSIALGLFRGFRGDGPARGDRRGRDAAEIDFRHRQVELAQHRIGQLVVVPKVAAQPMAPIGHATAGVILEGRLARVECR